MYQNIPNQSLLYNSQFLDPNDYAAPVNYTPQVYIDFSNTGMQFIPVDSNTRGRSYSAHGALGHSLMQPPASPVDGTSGNHGYNHAFKRHSWGGGNLRNFRQRGRNNSRWFGSQGSLDGPGPIKGIKRNADGSVLNGFQGSHPYQRSQSPSTSSVSSQDTTDGYQNQSKRRFFNKPFHNNQKITIFCQDDFQVDKTQQNKSNEVTLPFTINEESLILTATPVNLIQNCQYDKLSEAIWRKFMEEKQTTTTLRNKVALWKDLHKVVQSYDSRFKLFMVGSTLSGFGSDSSDVDMCLLVNRAADIHQLHDAVPYLQQFMGHLRKCDFITRPQFIRAKVPILKFSDCVRNIDVDLNCHNLVGIRNTQLLYAYSQLDWRVRPLVLIVKLWAQHHGINDAKTMTISSYSLSLMVIHFLQYATKPALLPCLHKLYPAKFQPSSDVNKMDMLEKMPDYESENKESLGELLLGFLKYYANEFDFEYSAISVRLAGKRTIQECQMAPSVKNYPKQWKFLCIEEPFDFTNTARSVYNPASFQQIVTVFRCSYRNLAKTLKLHSILDV